jgi:tetratricopeptide (TPR) repeat protein
MRRAITLLLPTILAASSGCPRDPGETQRASSAVIVRDAQGRTRTMDDLRGLSGSFSYELVGKSNVPAEAGALHQQARQAGEAGDYPKALTLLDRASALAPRWPYPVYDKAFTYLLMKDPANARKNYRKTVELAPRGFFTAITALDTLDREAKGDLPADTYLAYQFLEWIHKPEEKAQWVRKLVERTPGFAPAWKELADLSDDPAERLTAIEKGLATHPDAETKGALQINKALLLEHKGDHAGAVRLLGELALDPASTFATEQLAKVALANVEKNRT